jgi:RNA polymerase sigma-70 factor, ECF subfamily
LALGCVYCERQNVPLHFESHLIERAQSERGAALERVIEAVWPEAYRIAASILRDRGLAEDTAQEACVAIVGGLPKLRDRSTFAAWCYTIIVNRAVSAARSRRTTEPLEAVDRREVRFDNDEALDLGAALASLPVRQRAAVILHYYAGLSSREIAEATGLPRSTIRFHLMLARRRLRAALSRDREEHAATSSHEEVYTNAR